MRRSKHCRLRRLWKILKMRACKQKKLSLHQNSIVVWGHKSQNKGSPRELLKPKTPSFRNCNRIKEAQRSFSQRKLKFCSRKATRMGVFRVRCSEILVFLERVRYLHRVITKDPPSSSVQESLSLSFWRLRRVAKILDQWVRLFPKKEQFKNTPLHKLLSSKQRKIQVSWTKVSRKYRPTKKTVLKYPVSFRLLTKREKKGWAKGNKNA